jgi:hypothetical protein
MPRLSALRMLELAAEARSGDAVAVSSEELLEILHDLREAHEERQRLRAVAEGIVELLSDLLGVRVEIMGHELLPRRRVRGGR